MVGTMLKSALREIRQSLGRYLAILAIVGLGVGFFSGLRTSQPAMMATGIDYSEHRVGAPYIDSYYIRFAHCFCFLII